MKEIDYELLEKTIKFPLRIDTYGNYIWSKSNQMIAQFESKYRKLFADKIVGVVKKDITTNSSLVVIEDLDFYLMEDLIGIGCVRGWGDFQYNTNKRGVRKYDPERGAKIQDNLALYLLKCLNS